MTVNELKEELKEFMVSKKFYVGNSEVASMLRQLADEWDD